MNISAPFIARPIATALLMVGLLLGGLVTYRLLSGPKVDSKPTRPMLPLRPPEPEGTNASINPPVDPL